MENPKADTIVLRLGEASFGDLGDGGIVIVVEVPEITRLLRTTQDIAFVWSSLQLAPLTLSLIQKIESVLLKTIWGCFQWEWAFRPLHIPVEISHRTPLSLIRWVVSILVTILRYRYNHHRFIHSLLIHSLPRTYTFFTANSFVAYSVLHVKATYSLYQFMYKYCS